MPDRAEFSDRERELFERGREAHPELSPDVDRCHALWMRVLESGSVDEARSPDVFLVCAALADDPNAARELRRRIDRATQPLEGVDPDEIAQRCWLRLFSGEHRVLRYVGQGDLDGLLRVTTRRLALNASRDAPRDESLELALHAEDGAPQLDTQFASAQYKAAFKEGVEHAISTLPDEDRLLLKLHLVDSLGIDKLSGILGVHRATAARRLERARERVAKAVRAALRDTLGEAGIDDSHLRRVRSQLDVSLSRILGR